MTADVHVSYTNQQKILGKKFDTMANVNFCGNFFCQIESRKYAFSSNV